MAEEKKMPVHKQINEGFLLPCPGISKEARVLRSFYVKVQLLEGEYLATGDISDLFELGEAAGRAALNYLYSLVDELIWLRKHKESLSGEMLGKLNKLQSYLSLV